MKKTERVFQKQFITELKTRFSGCIVLKNDANYIQGIPDLLMLYKDRWFAFEVKRDAKASRRPNQVFYIRKMNAMSYASFVYPENKEEVLCEVEQSLELKR